jgi:excinuclease ABC subunit A
MPRKFIEVEGARQNNLKNVSIKLPLNELIVVTGVSGSGKSSLAFDTIYSEGQRRYVETFSPYARQFLDRMDRPDADRIGGIPPAIAIDQTNPVRTSRSTVGTMTELNDHFKLLFARAAKLRCESCGCAVVRETPDSIWKVIQGFASQRSSKRPLGGKAADVAGAKTGARGKATDGEHMLITFPVTVPENFTKKEIKQLLGKQGYTRFVNEKPRSLEAVQDRIALKAVKRGRVVESLEAALQQGRGHVTVRICCGKKRLEKVLRFSAGLHCAECDRHYRDPVPNLFSFNSPLGACEECRGFGRVIGIDYGLVVPDERKTLAEGAVLPFQSKSYYESQQDLMRFARKRGIPTDAPWTELKEDQRQWVLQGEGDWDEGVWYGASRFFRWLESRSYRMHVRVLLSKYRAYRECTACCGARLRSEALNWRLGKNELNIHDILLLPIDECAEFMNTLKLPAPLDEATELLLGEIRTRLQYLVEVGLGYLCLDRQSRTLSGGEVQRINLTTALGTSLVNTLFVLDEPSIGLHSRDIKRLIGVLHRLRDAGNTLIVVEHDPEVIRAADRIIDMGPGPGERGGEIMFFGRLPGLLRQTQSLTAQYLTGKRIAVGAAPESPKSVSRKIWLEVRGARANNLKNITARFPLNSLVCVTGVSGSGKSTLLQDVCYNALRKLKRKPVDEPGIYREITGHDAFAEVVLVDQSPIGKTTRSNPASYVGALTEIRKVFSKEPLARERAYGPGAFSFNSGHRCPSCEGNGFEHIEMQFLSDVYLRCPDCHGTRYREDVLEVKVQGAGFAGNGANSGKALRSKSIADVLEMTVVEACVFFADHPRVLRDLEPLQLVGLGYLRLGQPVPTLSGGEAQRLKLAGHLAKSKIGKRVNTHETLFLFDEPTTGLHFDDIATLLEAFRVLIRAGHSAIVIEHNLDVILASDWIVDLGPEGGEAGGRVVCSGTPAKVLKHRTSHTAAAMRDYSEAREASRAGTQIARVEERKAKYGAATNGRPRIMPRIEIHNAREHNLKDVNITIPRDAFTVITGVSGSGKSTVAFDLLFAEGQRRYLESLNAYARQFVQPAAKPDVDAILGIPPTVAIEQRTSRGGRKSTVATVTETYHFLRLLFVKLGVQHCPDCHVPIEPQTIDAIVAQLLREFRGKEIDILAPLVVSRKGYYTDLAKWAKGKGFSHLRVDGKLIPTDAWPRLDRFKEHDIELPVCCMRVEPKSLMRLRAMLEQALDYGKGVIYVASTGVRTRGRNPHVFSTERACPTCGRSFAELDPRLFSYNSRHGWCSACYGTGRMLEGFDEEQTGEELWWNERWDGAERACPRCHGRRLRSEALEVKFRNQSISDFTALTVEKAASYIDRLTLSGREAEIARDILGELKSKLRFLVEVGLPYLGLDRGAPTLSGGEARRVRLAAQLGSNLRGVCYILDEPSIGLHSRDNAMLLSTLAQLRAKGNTVVVVEHDETTIRQADHIVDLGPGAGDRGGEVVGQGRVRELLRSSKSVTGKYLRQPLLHPLLEPRPPVRKGKRYSRDVAFVEINGASLHNLKRVNLRIPLARLVCVTGVSGSGKSTLVRHIIYENLKRHIRNRRSKSRVTGCTEIKGMEHLNRVLEVDQAPIGKTSRSCPATYVKLWDEIRKLYATTPEAKMRGYSASRFSFNVRGGRCETCQGVGEKRIEMSFLPNVSIPCELCNGARFAEETLDVEFKGKSIGDVLAMSIDDATGFFSAHAKIHRTLRLLQDVGLGYLKLGQQSPTLSGGEAQRIKLVAELAKARDASRENPLSRKRSSTAGTLYVLDEPTIGLHMADVEKLIRVLHRLVDAGNSVIIIEHNLDVIAEADWVIDLGPEGGDGGGRIVAVGSPDEISSNGKGSYTAHFLRDFLKDRKRAVVK